MLMANLEKQNVACQTKQVNTLSYKVDKNSLRYPFARTLTNSIVLTYQLTHGLKEDYRHKARPHGRGHPYLFPK